MQIKSKVKTIVNLQNQSEKKHIFARCVAKYFDDISSKIILYWEYYYKKEIGQKDGQPILQDVVILSGNSEFSYSDVNTMYASIEGSLVGGITDKLQQAANLLFYQNITTEPTPTQQDNILGVKFNEWELI